MHGAARLLPPLLAVVLLAGCEQPPAHPWPAEVVDNFLGACRKNTGDAACRCAVDRLQRRFTLEEFQGFERELAKGTVPKQMADTISECARR